MYSRQETSKLTQEFWTKFGLYMKPIQSASGEKVNWSNYKTSISHVYFRLRVEKNTASVAIELTDPMEAVRHQQFEKFITLKTFLEETMGAELNWQKDTISKISATLLNVNILKESNWPAIISFFKPCMMGLDAFWADARLIF
jgi:hypothetical protein